MTIRMVFRHLPPDTTTTSLQQLFEQAGLSENVDGIKIQRIFVGKAATTTKSEVPSAAFVLVPNDSVGVKVCKKLVTKDSPVVCELAPIQRVADKVSTAVKNDTMAGTWQTDPEYLRFENLQKQKPKVQELSKETQQSQVPGAEPEKQVEVSALVMHMRKEMLARRNKSQKAKKDSRKRKPAAAKAAGGNVQKPSKAENS